MKTTLALILAMGLAGIAAEAKDQPLARCTVVAMNAVPCGTQQKRHKKAREMLYQEYILQTDSTEYHVRQKEEKHTELLPVGSEGEYRINKDKMKLRVPAETGKEREYVIVSVTHR